MGSLKEKHTPIEEHFPLNMRKTNATAKRVRLLNIQKSPPKIKIELLGQYKQNVMNDYDVFETEFEMTESDRHQRTQHQTSSKFRKGKKGKSNILFRGRR